MKTALNKEITVEFDEASLKTACEDIARLKVERGGTADEVLDAMLVALVFRHIERTTPGTVDKLLKACSLVKK